MQTIVRVQKRRRFVIIDQQAAEDASISDRARGLLLRLLAKPDDWTIRIDQLCKGTKEGRDATRKAFDELMKSGYVVRQERIREAGQLKQTTYIVHESPVAENPRQAPSAGNQRLETSDGKPAPDNPTLLKTHKPKTHTKEEGEAMPVQVINASDQAKLDLLIKVHGEQKIHQASSELYKKSGRFPYVSTLVKHIGDEARDNERVKSDVIHEKHLEKTRKGAFKVLKDVWTEQIEQLSAQSLYRLGMIYSKSTQNGYKDMLPPSVKYVMSQLLTGDPVTEEEIEVAMSDMLIVSKSLVTQQP